jgi:glycosyltransferase involved in cell wall biosynthesis
MITLAKRFKTLQIPFIWEIYGEGDFMSETNLKQKILEIPEMIFLGPRMNVQSYMVGADYLVQLSDTEGFCYSVYEALQLGIPVIVRNWDGVQNIGLTGYVFDVGISDTPDERIMKIYIDIPKKFEFNFKNNLQTWIDLIE